MDPQVLQAMQSGGEHLLQADVLGRNGTYVGFRMYQSRVGAFNRFLRAHGSTDEERELLAAKLVGRWRSGAPLTRIPAQEWEISYLVLFLASDEASYVTAQHSSLTGHAGPMTPPFQTRRFGTQLVATS